ncbi:MAG: LysR family transcriptional regulator [Novosphingobium sp.]|nr:LysR family transcriptional regulator [Novosphingobium sp.]
MRKLECVVALAEKRNFARAAEQIGVTQPALSRVIAQVEGHYGVRLFDRGRGGVSITRDGEALLADARQLIALARLAEHNLQKQGAGEAGMVKIGLGPLPAGLLLKTLLAGMVRDRPRTVVDSIVDSAERLLPVLDRREIDCCVVSEHFVPDDAVHAVRQVGEVRLGLFVRAAHPLAATGDVASASLGRWPLASGHAGVSGKLFGYLEPTILSDDFLALRALMLETDVVFLGGHGLVADDLARGSVVELRLDDGWIPPATRLVLVRLAGRSQSRAAWDVMDRIAALAAAVSKGEGFRR